MTTHNTKDLRSRGLYRLADDVRATKPEWLRTPQVESALLSHSQQLADEHSAVVELDRVEGVLLAKDTLKYRMHLPNHGKDLKPSTLLTLILKMVDEVINDAN